MSQINFLEQLWQQVHEINEKHFPENNLMPILGNGKTFRPKIMFVFINPTKRNIASITIIIKKSFLDYLINMITKEQIIDILKKINDPEIGIDVWTLELIYDIKVEDDKIDIKMTFTTPLCPYGPMIVEEIKQKLNELNPKSINIDVVFSPPWQPSEELRATLGV